MSNKNLGDTIAAGMHSILSNGDFSFVSSSYGENQIKTAAKKEKMCKKCDKCDEDCVCAPKDEKKSAKKPAKKDEKKSDKKKATKKKATVANIVKLLVLASEQLDELGLGVGSEETLKLIDGVVAEAALESKHMLKQAQDLLSNDEDYEEDDGHDFGFEDDKLDLLSEQAEREERADDELEEEDELDEDYENDFEDEPEEDPDTEYASLMAELDDLAVKDEDDEEESDEDEDEEEKDEESDEEEDDEDEESDEEESDEEESDEEESDEEESDEDEDEEDEEAEGDSNDDSDGSQPPGLDRKLPERPHRAPFSFEYQGKPKPEQPGRQPFKPSWERDKVEHDNPAKGTAPGKVPVIQKVESAFNDLHLWTKK